MKITKTEINKQLKRLWNNTKVVEIQGVGKYKVALVGWHHNQYKVIPFGVDFDTVAERSYKPLETFYYKHELINYLYTQLNKGR